MSEAGKRVGGKAGTQQSPTRKPMSEAELRVAIERYAEGVSSGEAKDALEAFQELKAALNAGTVRAAERGADGRWRANAWVKTGILLGFRLGRVGPAATGGPFPFYDKDTYPLRAIGPDQGIRLVPGGSAIRDGCFVGSAVDRKSVV